MKGNSYCRSCRNAITREWMRNNRKKHSELSEEERKKANCHAYTNTLVSRGKLTREPCRFCGTEKVQAHHEDYDKPREVIWVCRKCHLIHFHSG